MLSDNKLTIIETLHLKCLDTKTTYKYFMKIRCVCGKEQWKPRSTINGSKTCGCLISDKNGHNEISKRNTSGFIGITYDKKSNVWDCRIRIKGAVLFRQSYPYTDQGLIQASEDRNNFIIENNLPNTLN